MRTPALLIAWAAACSDDAGLVDARVIDAPAPGRLSLAWTIAHGGAPLTCAQIDAASVTLEIVEVDAAFGVVDSLSCASGAGVTRDLVPGTYNVRVTLESAGGTLDGPELRANIVVAPGQTVALAPFAFDVDPYGDLLFRVTTATTGNCTATDQGGAGITAMTIELRDERGACVPTTFRIAAGVSRPAGTYASNCAGASYACIAGDQDIRADRVASGPHALVIIGRVGTAPCWTRTATFRVSAAGILTALGNQALLRDGSVAGCP